MSHLDESERTDSFPYPRGSVVAIIMNADALARTRRRLAEAGFGADRCEILHGPDGLARIDEKGTEHGRTGRLMRRLQTR